MSQSPSPPSTRPILVDYQRRWLADPARWKLLVKARRIGGSFVLGLEDVSAAAGLHWDASGHVTSYSPASGVDQNICSASQAQAILLLEECARHVEALSYVVGDELARPSEIGKTQIRLRNGRTIRALAANPRTIRGARGDLTLDEFGAMARQRLMWAAAKATTDPTLGRPQGYRLRLVGTPLGDADLFYEFAKADRWAERFSRYSVDVHQAVRQGFPADIAALRDECSDADEFAQEYECAFLSAASRYISAELYASCEFDETDRPNATGVLYAGMDVARKQSGDLSALAEMQRINATLWQRAPVESRRGIPWDEQMTWVGDVLSRCGRIAIDATGLGSKFVEDLQTRHGESRVEAVEFTTKSKEMLATGTRAGMERHRVRLCREDAALRRALLSIRRDVTEHGNVRYGAERTADGRGGRSHADEAWALMLAVHAAGRPIGRSAGSGTGRGSEARSWADAM